MFVLKQIDSGIFDILFTKMKKQNKTKQTNKQTNLDLILLINVQT